MTEYIPGEILITFRQYIKQEQIKSILNECNTLTCWRVECFLESLNCVTLSVPTGQETDIINEITQMDGVVDASQTER